MTRVIDRGAVTAAYVGIGMAATIAISFLLVIPIEPIYWFLALPAGLLIGYYANQKSDRRAGPWARIVANALFAGAVTALTLARSCSGGQGAVLLRRQRLPRLQSGRRRDRPAGPAAPATAAGAASTRATSRTDTGDELASVGVTDAASFTSYYWAQQASAALTIIVLTEAGALFGGLAYGFTRPKTRPASTSADGAPA